MTKYIHTGQEVPHLFAADPKAYASNSNRSLFCESGVLYSYRKSAPIAAWFGADGSLTIGCHVILWPTIESALARYEAK
jgi:hypothetical protein